MCGPGEGLVRGTRATTTTMQAFPRIIAWLQVVAVMLAPGWAFGGERPYAYVQGAESLPETALELESWFGTERPLGQASTWDWWLGPVVGVTDRFELALYAIFLQPPGAPLDLRSLRWQASYLLADRGTWPVDVRVRVELGQPTGTGAYSGWLWLLASRDVGRVNLTANLVGWVDFPHAGDDSEVYLQYLAGASVKLWPWLRLGAEFQGESELSGDSPTTTTLGLGPAVAAGAGRVWMSAGYGFSLTRASPNVGRIVLGLAF
jgi:hypothetical protein